MLARVASPMLLPLPLLEAAMVVTWSSGFIGARYSIDHAPAFLVVFWRCLVVAAVLTPWVWRELRRTPLPLLGKQASIGFLAMTGYLGGVIQGIELGVPAGLAALIADLLPIGTAVIAIGLGQQQLSARAWAGLGIGLVGVIIVTQEVLGIGNAPLWAYGLPLLGMLSLAVASVWQKTAPKAKRVSMLATLWIQCFVATLCFGVACSFDTGIAPVASTGFAASVIWTALLSTLGGYGLYWICLQRSSPTRVASVLYFSPAVTIIWAWISFGEPFSWSIILGLCVSAVGVSMVIRSEPERRGLGRS